MNEQTDEELAALDALGVPLKVEVQADHTGTWCANGLRFENTEKALAYGSDLSWRWTAVRKYRVVVA